MTLVTVRPYLLFESTQLSPSVLAKFIHPFIYSDVPPDLLGVGWGVGVVHMHVTQSPGTQTNSRDKGALQQPSPLAGSGSSVN